MMIPIMMMIGSTKNARRSHLPIIKQLALHKGKFKYYFKNNTPAKITI